MNAFNAASSALFNVLLAPLGHDKAWFDLWLWPIVCGVVALVIYKYISNQKGIERAKDQIKVHIYEIRLFHHDPVVVLLSTAKVFLRNFIYIGHNLLPMVVLMVPMVAIMVQLVAHYAYAPSPVGDVQLLQVELDPDQVAVRPADVQLSLPQGVALDAPPVRTADGEVYYRLKAVAEGDHELKLTAGGETLTKTWAVGGPARKIPVLRTKSLESILYPGEAGVPSGSAFYSLALHYPDRALPWLPDGELGVLMWFMGLSLVAGFALKDVFGVTL